MNRPDEIGLFAGFVAEATGLDLATVRTALTALAGRTAAATERVPRRWQDAAIVAAIPAGASVLDLGCGRGDLLGRLRREKTVRGQGVELDAAEVATCIGSGVPVIRADVDSGLAQFADATFDWVVLEETLQTLRRPAVVLTEMLRVGRRGIVSFPNFGHWKVRLHLALHGRMPVTRDLPHTWHDTPNIHLFTLADLLDWAAANQVRVEGGSVLVDGRVEPLRGPDDNLRASEALLVLTRG